MPQTVFERVEKKYLLTPRQAAQLQSLLQGHLVPDEYGPSTVCSLYADTADYLLIRRSAEKPAYKEKLRLRTYGVPTGQSTAFLELKKKLNGTVYKRRLTLNYQTGLKILNGQRQLLPGTQIGREIGWFLQSYNGLRPTAAVFCERQAFCDRGDPTLRYTFDRNITACLNRLDLSANAGGVPLLNPGEVLLELKTGQNLPLWLCRLLSELKIYPTGFSKYGTLYQNFVLGGRPLPAGSSRAVCR